MNNTLKGTVKWFNDAKGFGFIENEMGDVFVHFSAIQTSGFKTLKNGEEVQYELDTGEKGLHAKKVLRLNPPKNLASQIEIERTNQSNSGPEGLSPKNNGSSDLVTADKAQELLTDINKDS